MITKFHEIGVTAQKKYKCACGRRLTRRKRFYQTLNPFNVNAFGKPKTQAEILDEVRLEYRTWATEPDECNHVPAAPKDP